MRRYSKSDKVADLLKHAVSNALLTHLGDERLRWVNVTEVQLTRDLSHAKIFYTVLEAALSREKAEEALEENLPKLKRHLAKNLRLRRLPELRLLYDEMADQANRIEELLDSVRKDDDDEPGTEDTDSH
jgi:ribosome-binding factor A